MATIVRNHRNLLVVSEIEVIVVGRGVGGIESNHDPPIVPFLDAAPMGKGVGKTVPAGTIVNIKVVHGADK